MADNIMGRRFYHPVYKDQTGLAIGDAGYGELIEAGDTLQVLLNAADGTKPLHNLTVISVGADGREVFWEHDAGNLYVHSDMVYAVAPKHQYTCPEARNIGLVAVDDITAEVTSITINGVVYTGLSFPVTAQGAEDAQEWLNTTLNHNGEATVVYVDTGTDYLQFYVMNTTAEITVNAEPMVALV